MLTVPSTDWENASGFGLDPQQFRNLTHSRVDKHLQGIKKLFILCHQLVGRTRSRNLCQIKLDSLVTRPV